VGKNGHEETEAGKVLELVRYAEAALSGRMPGSDAVAEWPYSDFTLSAVAGPKVDRLLALLRQLDDPERGLLVRGELQSLVEDLGAFLKSDHAR